MQHVKPLSRHLTRSSRLCTARPVQPYVWVSRRYLLTLAIETSCDDTCVAILEKRSAPTRVSENGHDRSNSAFPPDNISSATRTHAPVALLHFNKKVTAKNSGKGGIVPLEALMSHQQNLAKLLNTALLSLPLAKDAGDYRRRVICEDGSLRVKPDFVTVTRGPGMQGNLATGLETAKGLAVAWQVPLLGVHHMQAHALTPRLIHAMRETRDNAMRIADFPFLTLLVSGGHTMLLYSTGLIEHRILATTTDSAIGDALDKCGRLLLPDEIKAKASDTAFGKYLSQYAFPDRASFDSWAIPRRRKDEIRQPVNQYGWQIIAPMQDSRRMAFSFGAFQSQTERILASRLKIPETSMSPDEHLLLAQSIIGTAFEHLGSRTLIALDDLKARGIQIRNLVVSGGVAANDFLRHYLRTFLDIRGFEEVELTFPPVKYCTDNAAMIAWAGMEMYEAGYSSDLSIAAARKWSMDSSSEDGGILGVGGWLRSHFKHSS